MSAFAKSLRRKALQRIKASERLTAAHANRPRKWPHWVLIAVVFLGGLEMAIALPVLVAASTFFVLGPIASEVWDGKHLHYRPPAGIALAGRVHFVSGILAMTLAASGRFLFCRRLAALAYLPHRDYEGVRRSDRLWLAAMFLVAIWCFVVWRYAAIYQRVPLTHMLLLVPLAVAHGWAIYATAVVAVGLVRPAGRLADAAATWIFTSAGGYLLCLMTMNWPKKLPPLLDGRIPWSEQPPAWLESFTTFSGLLLPTGWVDAVVWYGVLRGEAWGWLFLLPCAALSALALWCRPRLISLREIRVSSHGQLTPVFADDPEPESAGQPAVVAAAGSTRPQPTTEVPSSPPAANRRAVLKRLLSGPPLGKTDWSAGWPLERLLGRLLTERQRVIVECTCGGVPSTTAACLGGLSGTVIWMFMWLGFIAVASEPILPTLAAAMAMFAPLFLCLASLGARSKRSQPRHLPSHPVFPIGFRETIYVGLKTGVLLLLVWLPVFITALACVAMVLSLRPAPEIYSDDSGWMAMPLAVLFDAGPRSLLSVLLAACLGAVILPALGNCSRFAMSERYELSLHRVCYLIVLTVTVFAGMTMLLSPVWPLTLAAALTFTVLGSLLWRYFDWLYHSGRLDYVDWRPPREEKR